MSLVGLAQDGSLPLIQQMDLVTLEWIKKNQPKYTATAKPNLSVIIGYTKKYEPSKEWFWEKDCINSIHGIRHIMRVVSNASNLIINRKIKSTTASKLLIACSLHDLRRKDDKGDKGHAKRAAEWFLKNCDCVSRKFSVTLSSTDIDEIFSAIILHEIPYSQIENIDKFHKHRDLIDLLKTADALDRYRLPKLKWWIDDRFIKIIPSDNEKMFAYNLIVDSEKKYLSTGDSVRSVFDSLIRI